MSASDDPRWSVTLKVGETRIDEDIVPDFPGWAVDGSDTSVGLAVGFELHRYLQIEAGYHDLGTYDGQHIPCPEVCAADAYLQIPTHPREVDFTGFSLVLVPKWPVTEKFLLYAKVGAFDWSGDVTKLFDSQPIADPSDTDLLTGVGARFGAERGVGVQLEYERSALHDHLNLGASWRF
ncbi:MAG: hypothetical protein MPN21_24730 [Thermoanaerobaculia bacterium]|nr:hypothetical protein [Thermoanaerobaculia bacterium]